MVIAFYGAAESVTGSKHLVTLENGKRILLDCGMFQGEGEKGDQANREFLFNPESINYLILSHAHIDHSGLIPLLVKKGFQGTIYCTPSTLELTELILNDSAHIQRSNGHGRSEKPLYNEEDVEHALTFFKTVEYDHPFKIDEDIELVFTDSGHIMGSAAVNLKIKESEQERTLCFSGDVGRFSNRILRPPQPFPPAEIIILESTYGDKLHDTISDSEGKLEKIVKDTCIEKGGKLIIPSFSIGRTQELIYTLNYLAEEGRLGNIKVFVDSPLSVYATDIIKSHPENFNAEMTEYIKTDPDPFGFKNLHFVIDTDDSILLKELDESCVIISSSGMMEAGRIRHHLRTTIESEKNTILITGYCEPSTLGGKLIRGHKEVFIIDRKYEVKAEILLMKEYSAHADYGDLLKFLVCQDKEKVKQIFLVHGEKPTMEKFKKELNKEGYKKFEIAQHRISYKV